MPLVVEELFTIPERPSSHPVFNMGLCYFDLPIYVYNLWIVVCPFVLCLLTIVLSVLLRFTDYDCLIGISKLYLHGGGYK